MEPPAQRSVVRILIADDDADMRFYLRGCLRSLRGLESIRVHEASDGREALHLARALVPDLVITDIVMPGLDGHALYRALQADEATADVPVLLISGEDAVTGEADGFLAKPFNANKLRAEVERLLRGPP